MTLKLTVEQLEEATTLGYRIGKLESFKDQKGEPRLQIDGMCATLPVPREAVNAAVHQEIARCHEELKAMGISLMPSAPLASGGGVIGGYFMPAGIGSMVGGLVGGQVDRNRMPDSKLEDLKASKVELGAPIKIYGSWGRIDQGQTGP